MTVKSRSLRAAAAGAALLCLAAGNADAAVIAPAHQTRVLAHATSAGTLKIVSVWSAQGSFSPGAYGYAPIAQCPAGYEVLGTGFQGPMTFPQGGFLLNYGTFVAGFFEQSPAYSNGVTASAYVEATCAQLSGSGAASARAAGTHSPAGVARTNLTTERAAFARDLAFARAAARHGRVHTAAVAIARRHHGVARASSFTGNLDVVTVAGSLGYTAPGGYGYAPPAQCPPGYRVTGTGFWGPLTYPQGGFVLNYGTLVDGFFDQISSGTSSAPTLVQATCARLYGAGSLNITTANSALGYTPAQGWGPSNGVAQCPSGYYSVGTGFWGPMTGPAGGGVLNYSWGSRAYGNFVSGYFDTYQTGALSEPAQSPNIVQATCAQITG